MQLPTKSCFTPNKFLLTETFALMGPDRVVLGLVARRSSWKSCFLAKAYPEHNLARKQRVHDRATRQLFTYWDNAALLTGLPKGLVDHVTTAFDSSRESRAILRRWAREWLELNREPRHEPSIGAHQH